MITLRTVAIVRDVYVEHFIMHVISQDTIIYNISWEDPRVEREAIGIGKDDVVLTISSAGCNVLDYLIEGPKAIEVCRQMMGATFGFKADPGTIRGDFGISNQYNLVHGSDGPEAAEREIGLFFPGGEGLLGWESADASLHACD